MAADYYSDRTRGPQPRRNGEITEAVWGGVVALVERGIARASFGHDFPLECEDGQAICGCDYRAFGLALAAEIPDLDWPFSERVIPPTLAVLDLLEFVYRHASAPRERDYHSFYRHSHFTFDVDKGRDEMWEQINRLLARGGMAYELDEYGKIERLASPAVEAQLARELPPTRDQEFDDLLETATAKYRSPEIAVRREALEKLWDAYERSKTILESKKKDGVKALIRALTDGADPEEVKLVEAEMHELTEVGNSFRIRHHETGVAALSDALVDQLFARMYALLYRVNAVLR
ncbi:MAG TPA: hypothetical protein VF081_10645 [Solirubrobacterales bacterium]